jgi:hypothetical protein
MIEKDDKFQIYANDIVKNVPGEYLQYLISLFMREAAINLGCDENETTLERTIYYVKRDYSYMPINFVASAFIRGSLGQIGDGKGRLVPKTIVAWLADSSLAYNRLIANQKNKENLNDVSIAMDLHKYPVGSAIVKKIEWYRKGLLTSNDWDKVPLKELAEMIKAGHNPIPEYFKI